MSNKCRAYSASKIGLEKPDNRKAFYAGWDAAIEAELRQAIEQAEKQEPYAYIYETSGPFGVHQSLRHAQYNGRYPDKTIPVYTAPMSIKPENIDTKSAHVDPVDIEPVAWKHDCAALLQNEAKLKEKNT